MDTVKTKKKTFKEKFYQDHMPKVYGFGAAIVIAGAMFKLLNWPGGALMLGLGLTTEAIIFILSAFEPEEKKIKWEKVYPQLSDNFNKKSTHNLQSTVHGNNQTSISEKLDEIFSKAKLDVNLIKNLGAGMEKLSISVEKMSSLSIKSNALNEYLENVEKANQAIQSMQKIFSQTTNTLQMLGTLEKNIAGYTKHMQFTTDNMEEIHQLYKQIITNKKQNQEINTKYQSIFDQFAQDMQKTTEESAKFKHELHALNTKISSLNNMYSKMLHVIKT